MATPDIGAYEYIYEAPYVEGAIIFNGHLYYPLSSEDGVPDVSAELSPKWEGGFTINAGTLSFINPWLKKEWTFDKNFERYLWPNAKVKILAGGDGFTYAQFYPWATGTVTENYELSDVRLTLPLRDTRDALDGLMLPTSLYSAADFPLADTNIIGTRRPFGFGVITGAVPKCINTTDRVFEFHAGRCKSVEGVYQNGTTLTVDTDYFVDYQHGRITLARGLTYATSDKITVDFTGAVDDKDTVIKNGGLIFLYALRNFAGMALADIDLDSIYDTAAATSFELMYYIFKDTGFGEFSARLERSILAFAYQDGQGRIGFKTTPAAAPSSILYLGEQYITDFTMNGGEQSRYGEIQVCYTQAQDDKWSYATATLNTMKWKYGVYGQLDVETAVANSADAATLRASIIAALDKPVANIACQRRLYTAEIGDLVYFTRTRYFSQYGTASNLLMRITKLGKAAGGTITARLEAV